MSNYVNMQTMLQIPYKTVGYTVYALYHKGCIPHSIYTLKHNLIVKAELYQGYIDLFCQNLFHNP